MDIELYDILKGECLELIFIFDVPTTPERVLVMGLMKKSGILR